MRLGRYELLGRLARGGMGEVFLARRKGPGDIEKRVVIKRIRSDLSGDPRFVEMFLREAKVSMTLSHRNIASVFDFGRAGQDLFLAMEHVDGRDLARALSAARKAGKELSRAACVYLAIEVCRALAYAHDAKDEPIIHRDLSPKNILLSFSGEVVVADFGLAVESTEQAEPGKVRGTPAYLSPEQARGDALDARSDLFSLGLILRELVTGEPVYRGETPAELIELARHADIEKLGNELDDLGQVIDKATARDRDDRYVDPQAMLSALDEVLVSFRAAGAPQPGPELGAWLRGLFPETALDEAGTADPVEVVTYLDDGDDAATRGVLELGDSTLASQAATVGESIAGADGSAEAAVSERPRSRFRLLLPLIALAAAGGAIAVILTSSSSSPQNDVVDAAPTDAKLAPIDAELAPIDVEPVVVDAAPDAAAKRAATGWLKIQSQPWARITVRGTPGCDETPCKLKLAIGRHRVVAVNPVTKARATATVTIREGETVELTMRPAVPE